MQRKVSRTHLLVRDFELVIGVADGDAGIGAADKNMGRMGTIFDRKESGISVEFDFIPKPRKGRENISVKNYSQLSELFVMDRYGSIPTNFTDEIRKRAAKKRTFINNLSQISNEVDPTFNTSVLNSRFAVELPKTDQIKHKFPGLKPSRSENQLKLNKSVPDSMQIFKENELEKSPYPNKPRDSLAQPQARHRKNVWAANIFHRLPY